MSASRKSIRHAAATSRGGCQIERRSHQRERRQAGRPRAPRRERHREELVDQDLPAPDGRGEQEVERARLLLPGDRPRAGADREDEEEDRPQRAERLAPKVAGRRVVKSPPIRFLNASGSFSHVAWRSAALSAHARVEGRVHRRHAGEPNAPADNARCWSRSVLRAARSRRTPPSGSPPVGAVEGEEASSRLGSRVSTTPPCGAPPP